MLPEVHRTGVRVAPLVSKVSLLVSKVALLVSGISLPVSKVSTFCLDARRAPASKQRKRWGSFLTSLIRFEADFARRTSVKRPKYVSRSPEDSGNDGVRLLGNDTSLSHVYESDRIY